jgi:hypothetical protein
MTPVKRGGVVAGVVMASALALSACGAGTASRGTPAGTPGHPAVVARQAVLHVQDPPSFALATFGPTELSWTIDLVSPATGRTVSVLGTFGDSFTNNGLAISPDGRDVYFTLIRPKTLIVERIAAGSRPVEVAAGEEPALSPDGHLLAFLTGDSPRSERLAVRDLSSGTTRTIDLTDLVGPSMDLLNGKATWLGDGSEIVVVPGGMMSATAPGTERPPPPSGSCSATSSGSTCLIVVRIAGGVPASPRRVVIPGIGHAMTIASDDALPRSLLVADLEGQRTILARVDLTRTGADVVRMLSLRGVFPVSFDPAGGRLLYLAPLGTPSLWIARIGPGHLVGPRLLVPHPRLGTVAW